MKNRKLMLVIAVLMIAALFSACAPKEEAVWNVSVEGAGKSEFTNADYAKLNEVKVETVLKKKDGSETPQTWEGVLLKDVIEYLGVKDYASITLEASDGYAKDYTPDIVNDDKTILGAKLDGKELNEEDGYIQAVAANQSGNMWIKQLAKIKVNK